MIQFIKSLHNLFQQFRAGSTSRPVIRSEPEYVPGSDHYRITDTRKITASPTLEIFAFGSVYNRSGSNTDRGSGIRFCGIQDKNGAMHERRHLTANWTELADGLAARLEERQVIVRITTAACPCYVLMSSYEYYYDYSAEIGDNSSYDRESLYAIRLEAFLPEEPVA